LSILAPSPRRMKWQFLGDLATGPAFGHVARSTKCLAVGRPHVALVAVLVVPVGVAPGDPLTTSGTAGSGLAFALPTLPLGPLADLVEGFPRTSHTYSSSHN